jgi:hypothetical protein
VNYVPLALARQTLFARSAQKSFFHVALQLGQRSVQDKQHFTICAGQIAVSRLRYGMAKR